MNNEMNARIETVFPAGVIIEHVDADAMKAVIDAIWWEAVDYPYLRAAELLRNRYALIDTEIFKILDWKEAEDFTQESALYHLFESRVEDVDWPQDAKDYAKDGILFDLFKKREKGAKGDEAGRLETPRCRVAARRAASNWELRCSSLRSFT